MAKVIGPGGISLLKGMGKLQNTHLSLNTNEYLLFAMSRLLIMIQTRLTQVNSYS